MTPPTFADTLDAAERLAGKPDARDRTVLVIGSGGDLGPAVFARAIG